MENAVDVPQQMCGRRSDRERPGHHGQKVSPFSAFLRSSEIRSGQRFLASYKLKAAVPNSVAAAEPSADLDEPGIETTSTVTRLR